MSLANMDQLLDEQNVNVETLQQAISTYKKSPKDRTTIEYIEKWQSNIQNLWQNFQRVDQRLRNELPKDHEYLKKDLFALLGSKCYEIHTTLESDLAKARLDKKEKNLLPKDVSTSRADGRDNITKKSPETIKLEKQKQIIEIVKTMIQSTLEPTTVKTYQFYELQLKTIQQHWLHAQTLHEQLWTVAEDTTTYDYKWYIATESEINNGLLMITELMQQLAEDHQQGKNGNAPSSRVQLPQLELPKFDGNYLQWRQFHDLFLELVHNSNIPLCQKMIYLKTSLHGEAKALIAHFSTAAVNYNAAWNVLIDRYENKRILVNVLIAKLLAQPHNNTETATSLKLLHDVTHECLLSLRGLNIRTENWDPILLHILVQRLSKASHAYWEQSLSDPTELPTITQFLEFLKNRFQSLEAVQANSSTTTTTHANPKKVLGASATINMKCNFCNNSHQIYNCSGFLKMSPKERLNFIQKSRCCVNCLKYGHNSKACKSSKCTKCGKNHNSLLHLGQKEEAPKSNLMPAQPVTATTARSISFQSTPVLLSTARVYITDHAGNKHECRALLDSGSQANFMTKRLANTLGLQESSSEIGIEGIGQTRSKTKGQANIEITSLLTGFKKRIEVHLLSYIVSTQPSEEIDHSKWEIPANIKLADKDFAHPGRIDLLIGAGLFYSILSVGQISLGDGLPVLQNTVLGWVVGGEYNAKTLSRLHCGVGVTEKLNKELEKFWKLEEFEAGSKMFTANERRCEKHFLDNVRKTQDGRFVVRLPFEISPKQLGESKDIALQRFNAIERRLEARPSLRAEYNKFMREYEDLHHMKEISLADIKDHHYFLPHHAVFKAESTTTKVRVVFDASAKTSTNYSLNDVLATGPSVQADVFTTILRFRFPRFAFTADIEKMYRQIWINEEDRKYQLIWWRENPKLPLRCMQLSTVTYGTTCASYLATRVLQYIAEKHQEQYPLAAQALFNNFYVDDVLAGTDKITTALDLQQQLQQVLHSAGFHLRKWCANDSRLLQKIPETDKEVFLNLPGSTLENVKTMGITWYPKDDLFTVKISQEYSNKITKRTTLADISKLFDPLGLVAPVVVTAKIFLQQLWKLKLDWDASLPQELYTKWSKFREELKCLEKLSIPRHIYSHRAPKDIQLHIFADASELAYGAAVYVRSVDKSNVIIVRLLCSKSRVAPVKQVTLPRLELCAAKLATDLVMRLHNDKILEDCPTFYWTDSTAVLGWINASSSNYHTFVANRISSIQQMSTPQQWHHVRSEQNPADLISRGLMPEQLTNNTFWFYGPVFLHAPMTAWPLQAPRQTCELELRQKASISSAIATSLSQSIFDFVNHKNSITKFQKIIAYVLRFISNCQQKHRRNVNNKASVVSVEKIKPPTAIEMENGLQMLVKISQQQDFAEEIKALQKNKCVDNNSSISSLSPFIDQRGIIRVGGRLQAASLPFDAKHQMILPYHHSLTKMLFNNTHKQHLHVGTQGLLAIVRQRFWPLKGKNVARSTIQACIFCSKAKPKLFKQLMGALPKDRVQPARPFLTAGVDFFGPVWVYLKLRGKRPLKSYVAVFCCFSTKAVHMELVSDLTTEAFLGALRRFMARRGNCSKLYCDNATNFIGARNQLNELKTVIFQEKAQRQISSECSKRSVEFSFIPPRAPHFGGLWEAAVKSAKTLLQSTISAANLSREEMETLLAEAEAIMNSRPITPMSSDPNDLTALTPGHFLIGEPLTSTADPYAQDCNLKPIARWKVVTHLKMEFWKRWTAEYLNTLQHRYKWKQKVYDIKPNTMVLIKEDNLPSLKWSLGRITNVIRGDDGLVRVADVKTATNIIRRPITKLAPLPIDNDFADENEQIVTSEVDTETYDKSHRSKRPKLMQNILATLFLVALLLPLCTASSTELHVLQAKPCTHLNTIITCKTIISLLMYLVLPYINCSQINFIPFQGNPGIYFERIGIVNLITSNWNLINYIDLNPFLHEVQLTNSYVRVLKDTCDNQIMNTYCNVTIQRIQQQIQILEDNNQLLYSNFRIKRGAFNLVGNVAHDLFGVLDSEYAEQLSVTIENLKSNDDLLKRHMENQTVFLDRTLNIIKKDQDQFEHEIAAIEKLLNSSTNKMNNLITRMHQNDLSSMFAEVSLLTYMQITKVESIQNSIIDILTDSHHGNLSPELLTPKELQTELSTIENFNKQTNKLPLPIENITQYYRVMTISHQITKKFIIFNVQIPLVSFKQYELLKLTAIPWFRNNHFVQLKLSAKYLVIDMLREDHFIWKDHEVQGCIILDDVNFLCHQSQPMYNHKTAITQCELNLLKQAKVTHHCSTMKAGNGSFWSALHDRNSWVYSVGLNEQLNIVCNNIPSQRELSGNGIMHIEEGCIVKTNQITIEGRGLISKTRHIAYTPTANISELPLNVIQEYGNYSILYHKSNEEINKLQEELHQVKTISLNTVRSHDIHHYGLGYTVLFLVLLCIMGIIALYYKQIIRKKPQRAPRRHIEVPPNDIESQIITMY